MIIHILLEIKTQAFSLVSPKASSPLVSCWAWVSVGCLPTLAMLSSLR